MGSFSNLNGRTGNAPCKGCKERSIGCHSECEKYAEFRKKCNKMSEKIREEKSRRGWINYAKGDVQQ